MMAKNSGEKKFVEDEIFNRNSQEWIKFPFDIEDVDTKTNLKLLQDFTGERTGYVRIGPKEWLFPNSFKKDAELYYNFKPRPNDVWIVTFPRSGTTMMQELIWLLANNLNYEVASQILLALRVPFLEFHSCHHPAMIEELLEKNSSSAERCSLIRRMTVPKWNNLIQTTERRFIKTHLPLQLLSPDLLESGCKVIYLARNPKDVVVSYYHFTRAVASFGYLGDFPKYWHYFKNGLQMYTPYWAHLEEGWNQRRKENFLFLFYEDVTKDLKKSIMQVTDFLEVECSKQQADVLEEHLKIENFRNNKAVNPESVLKDVGFFKGANDEFIRKGKTGGWREYFIDELNEDVNTWIEENLEKTGIKFPEF